MAEVNKDLEEKVLEWAKTDKKARRYLQNIPLITGLYIQNHVAERVTDCIDGTQAALKLVVTKIFDPRSITLCTKCKRKTCDSDKCGAGDYEDMEGVKFIGTDARYKGDDPDDANMAVSIAPWVSKFDNYVKKMAYGDVLEVKGKIRSYENNNKTFMELVPESITSIDDDDEDDSPPPKETEAEPEKKKEKKVNNKFDKDVHDAVNYARDVLKMNGNKVPCKRWDSLMKDYSEEVVECVMQHLKLTRSDEFVEK